MTPIIKKTLFRIKELASPLKTGRQQKKLETANAIKKFMLAALVTFVVIGLIYSSRLPIRTSLNEGDIAVDDIYAPFDFKFEAGIDEEATNINKKKAEEGVADIYSIDESVYSKAKKEAESYFDLLISFQKEFSALPEEEKTPLLKKINHHPK